MGFLLKENTDKKRNSGKTAPFRVFQALSRLRFFLFKFQISSALILQQ
jgi:hypothetical protein